MLLLSWLWSLRWELRWDAETSAVVNKLYVSNSSTDGSAFILGGCEGNRLSLRPIAVFPSNLIGKRSAPVIIKSTKAVGTHTSKWQPLD